VQESTTLDKMPLHKVRLLIIVIVLLTAKVGMGQDTLKVFGLEDLYGLIANTHPVVKQANLLSESARQEIRIARGGFDPKLSSQLYRKEFGGKTYYNTWDSYLSIPVWLGTDIKIGHERTHGVNLNPENTTPATGLNYAGISVPVGQGLFIDQRRATLRQAQLFQEIAEADRLKLINKITLDAAKDYWDWFYAYRQYIAMLDGFRLAEVRFRAIKERVRYGDLAPIDTLEAKIFLQDRNVQLQQAQVDIQNARIRLSNYLWNEDMVPLELDPSLIPDTSFRLFTNLTGTTLEQMLNFASEKHPDLIKLDFKLKQLDVEQRLAREMLKPVINLQYNLLQNGSMQQNDINQTFLTNNYKLGVQFLFPLFLRKERGKLQLTNAKITSAEYERMNRNREIRSSVQSTYNELVNMEQLLATQAQMLQNYQVLWRSEVMKFEAGESSLFLINSRETKLIEAQVKLASLQSKYLKAKATMIWAAGLSKWDNE
jgi:outer membrane protein